MTIGEHGPGRQEQMDAVLIITLQCACFKRCAASFKSHHKQRAQPSWLQAIPQTGLPVEVCFFPLCSSQRKDTNKCAQIFPMFSRFQPRAHKRGLTDAFYVFFVCLLNACFYMSTHCVVRLHVHHFVVNGETLSCDHVAFTLDLQLM